MKKRILSGWNFQRLLFLVIGVTFLIQSAYELQWIGVAIGAYFAAMGLLAFGCASPNGCVNPMAYDKEIDQQPKADSKQIKYEEIKNN